MTKKVSLIGLHQGDENVLLKLYVKTKGREIFEEQRFSLTTEEGSLYVCRIPETKWIDPGHLFLRVIVRRDPTSRAAGELANLFIEAGQKKPSGSIEIMPPHRY